MPLTPEELHAEWHDDDSTGLRPARIQRVRTALEDATGMDIPRRRHEIEDWLDSQKGVVTRRLNEAVGSDEPDESADTNDTDTDE